jgi:hypothetical protein
MWAQNMRWWHSKFGKGKERIFPWNFQRQCALADTLVFRPVILILGIWFLEWWESMFLLFAATNFLVYFFTAATENECNCHL